MLVVMSLLLLTFSRFPSNSRGTAKRHPINSCAVCRRRPVCQFPSRFGWSSVRPRRCTKQIHTSRKTTCSRLAHLTLFAVIGLRVLQQQQQMLDKIQLYEGLQPVSFDPTRTSPHTLISPILPREKYSPWIAKSWMSRPLSNLLAASNRKGPAKDIQHHSTFNWN